MMELPSTVLPMAAENITAERVEDVVNSAAVMATFCSQIASKEQKDEKLNSLGNDMIGQPKEERLREHLQTQPSDIAEKLQKSPTVIEASNGVSTENLLSNKEMSSALEIPKEPASWPNSGTQETNDSESKLNELEHGAEKSTGLEGEKPPTVLERIKNFFFRKKKKGNFPNEEEGKSTKEKEEMETVDPEILDGVKHIEDQMCEGNENNADTFQSEIDKTSILLKDGQSETPKEALCDSTSNLVMVPTNKPVNTDNQRDSEGNENKADTFEIGFDDTSVSLKDGTNDDCQNKIGLEDISLEHADNTQPEASLETEQKNISPLSPEILDTAIVIEKRPIIELNKKDKDQSQNGPVKEITTLSTESQEQETSSETFVKHSPREELNLDDQTPLATSKESEGKSYAPNNEKPVAKEKVKILVRMKAFFGRKPKQPESEFYLQAEDKNESISKEMTLDENTCEERTLDEKTSEEMTLDEKNKANRANDANNLLIDSPKTTGTMDYFIDASAANNCNNETLSADSTAMSRRMTPTTVIANYDPKILNSDPQNDKNVVPATASSVEDSDDNIDKSVLGQDSVNTSVPCQKSKHGNDNLLSKEDGDVNLRQETPKEAAVVSTGNHVMVPARTLGYTENHRDREGIENNADTFAIGIDETCVSLKDGRFEDCQSKRDLDDVCLEHGDKTQCKALLGIQPENVSSLSSEKLASDMIIDNRPMIEINKKDNVKSQNDTVKEITTLNTENQELETSSETLVKHSPSKEFSLDDQTAPAASKELEEKSCELNKEQTVAKKKLRILDRIKAIFARKPKQPENEIHLQPDDKKESSSKEMTLDENTSEEMILDENTSEEVTLDEKNKAYQSIDANNVYIDSPETPVDVCTDSSAANNSTVMFKTMTPTTVMVNHDPKVLNSDSQNDENVVPARASSTEESDDIIDKAVLEEDVVNTNVLSKKSEHANGKSLNMKDEETAKEASTSTPGPTESQSDSKPIIAESGIKQKGLPFNTYVESKEEISGTDNLVYNDDQHHEAVVRRNMVSESEDEKNERQLGEPVSLYHETSPEETEHDATGLYWDGKKVQADDTSQSTDMVVSRSWEKRSMFRPPWAEPEDYEGLVDSGCDTRMTLSDTTMADLDEKERSWDNDSSVSDWEISTSSFAHGMLESPEASGKTLADVCEGELSPDSISENGESLFDAIPEFGDWITDEAKCKLESSDSISAAVTVQGTRKPENRNDIAPDTKIKPYDEIVLTGVTISSQEDSEVTCETKTSGTSPSAPLTELPENIMEMSGNFMTEESLHKDGSPDMAVGRHSDNITCTKVPPGEASSESNMVCPEVPLSDENRALLTDDSHSGNKGEDMGETMTGSDDKQMQLSADNDNLFCEIPASSERQHANSTGTQLDYEDEPEEKTTLCDNMNVVDDQNVTSQPWLQPLPSTKLSNKGSGKWRHLRSHMETVLEDIISDPMKDIEEDELSTGGSSGEGKETDASGLGFNDYYRKTSVPEETIASAQWTHLVHDIHHGTDSAPQPLTCVLHDDSQHISSEIGWSVLWKDNAFDSNTPLFEAKYRYLLKVADENLIAECVPDPAAFDPNSDMGQLVGRMKNTFDQAETSKGGTSPRYDNLQSQAALQALGVKVGEKVMVAGVKSGILRYCGPTEFASGIWAGIELAEPAGKNDGSVGGTSYFKCSPKYGIFAPISKISRPRSASSSPLKISHSRIDTSHVTARVDTGSLTYHQVQRNAALNQLGPEYRSSLGRKTGPEDLEIGERVLVAGQRKGVIRYCGDTEFAPGLWYGIELDRPVGKNDGNVNGTEYFNCKPKYGVFAPPSRVQRLSEVHGSRDSLDSMSASAMDRQRRLSISSSGSQQSLHNSPSKKAALARPKSSSALGLRRSFSNVGSEFKLTEGMSVFCNNELGVVRYIGAVDFAEGVWLGIELRTPKGKNDGSVQGKRYFTCRQNYGLIVRPSKVTVRGINGAKLLGDAHSTSVS